ncbi:MAG: InlB B-repeat-containing protein [Spirochaetaceae bacterium]|jgi:hypothetical protein|nr:InlB B-repeat-containing protein [Spirochaetaceae bacterium]
MNRTTKKYPPYTHNGLTNRGRFCLTALFLLTAAVFVGGCDGPHTLREYLEARQKRKEEASSVPVTPPAPETPPGPEIPPVPEFVPVTDITLACVASVALEKPLTLAAVVVPGNATNRTISWTVINDGDTGAVITGGVFTAPEKGTAVVRASAANGKGTGEDFTKDFTIAVGMAAPPVVSAAFAIKPLDTAAAAVTFTLTKDPPYEGGLVWNVYTAASGNTLASGVLGVAVTVSGSTLTLSHASNVPEGTYYVSVIEPGKGESGRLALYVVGRYSIAFHPNGGAMPGGSPETYLTHMLPLTLPTPTFEGRVFLGWYDNAQFTGSPVTAIPAGSSNSKEFWALWRSRTPTVSSGTAAKTVDTAMANVSFTLTNNPPFEDGLVWRVYAAASGDALAEGVTASSSGGALTLSHAADVPGGTYYAAVTESGRAESLRLALTVIGEYSITYNLNGGSGAGNGTYRTNGLPYTLPVLHQAGKIFWGWFGNAGLSGDPVWEIPQGSTGHKTYWAKWGTPASLDVDVGMSVPCAGPDWTYKNGVITIQDAADVTLTGSTTANRVAVESGATVTVKLKNVSISVLGAAFDGSGADVTLLLEGTNHLTGNTEATTAGYGLIAGTSLVIDSAAGSGSVLGTLHTASNWIASATNHGTTITPAQGPITQLGGVVTATGSGRIGMNGSTHVFGNRGIVGALTAQGGVTIAYTIGALTRPAGSTAVVFVGSAWNHPIPDDLSEDDHTDLAVCGSEWSIDGSAITLNAPLTIPSGVTLRVPAGWTLKLNGNVLTIEPGGAVICTTNTASTVTGSVTTQAGNGALTD